MSRPAGQVGGWAMLAGLGVAVAAMVAMVALCAALRPDVALPAEQAAQVQRPVAPLDCEDTEVVQPPAAVSSAELLDCPERYDGRRVRFDGEVVGAVLQRGDRAWLQLNDDAYGTQVGALPASGVLAGGNAGIAVSVPVDAVDGIAFVGGNRAQGDLLAVEGVFRLADPDDGGGTTIAADAVRVEGPGRRFDRPVPTTRLAVAAAVGAVAVALTVTALRARSRT